MGLVSMKIGDALKNIRLIYVESAPLIYYIEENPTYVSRIDTIIEAIENTPIEAVSSVITLTEVLIHPLILGKTKIEQEYRDILINSGQFRLLPVTQNIADSAADLRARYNLRTPDALHIATAIDAGCDAFLTNDNGLKRVAEITVLVLDDLEQ
jgi:predicted nucleic acid-binding protein